MGKILNSPKGVKSGVLESEIIFAAHVATVMNCVPKLMTQSQTGGGGGGGQGGSLITIHKEKKHLFTFHVENKLNSHFTWN